MRYNYLGVFERGAKSRTLQSSKPESSKPESMGNVKVEIAIDAGKVFGFDFESILQITIFCLCM